MLSYFELSRRFRRYGIDIDLIYCLDCVSAHKPEEKKLFTLLKCINRLSLFNVTKSERNGEKK